MIAVPFVAVFAAVGVGVSVVLIVDVRTPCEKVLEVMLELKFGDEVIALKVLERVGSPPFCVMAVGDAAVRLGEEDGEAPPCRLSSGVAAACWVQRKMHVKRKTRRVVERMLGQTAHSFPYAESSL